MLTTACLGQKQKEASGPVMGGKMLSVLVVRGAKNQNTAVAMDEFTKLQEVWTQLERQDTLWKHLQVVLLLWSISHLETEI